MSLRLKPRGVGEAFRRCCCGFSRPSRPLATARPARIAPARAAVIFASFPSPPGKRRQSARETCAEARSRMSVTEYLQSRREQSLAELNELLRIPSISAKSEHKGDTAAAAEWLAGRMRAIGLTTVEVVPTAGHPVVLGEWRGAEGAPTLLVYGHYDVQPPEPLDEWKTPPFEPTVRDDRLYARGSVDDKGQVYLHLKAVEAHLKTSGSLPVNVVFCVEGEEEVGSPH